MTPGHIFMRTCVFTPTSDGFTGRGNSPDGRVISLSRILQTNCSTVLPRNCVLLGSNVGDSVERGVSDALETFHGRLFLLGFSRTSNILAKIFRETVHETVGGKNMMTCLP